MEYIISLLLIFTSSIPTDPQHVVINAYWHDEAVCKDALTKLEAQGLTDRTVLTIPVPCSRVSLTFKEPEAPPPVPPAKALPDASKGVLSMLPHIGWAKKN